MKKFKNDQRGACFLHAALRHGKRVRRGTYVYR